jgi:protein SCO1/2
MRIGVLLALAACWGDDAFIVEGTVVETHGDREVVIDHEPIKGLDMEAMAMPFDVRDPSLLVGVQAGDHVVGRLMIEQDGSYLSALRVTAHGPAPVVADHGPAPIHPGELLPATAVALEDGTTTTIGAGQGIGTAVAFLYTRCAMPEFCPVSVTIDPAEDTPEVLAAFARKAGARPEAWHFGRVEGKALDDLAMRAALSISGGGGDIVHGSRLLILDANGRLIERYDDNRWPMDRVAEQLTTGGPAAPPGSDGTITPAIVAP